RVRAAFCAMAARFFAESFAARATPPFFPPRRPRATAAGFFPAPGGAETGSGASLVATATIRAASWLRSRKGFVVLERLGIVGAYQSPARIARPREKRAHCFSFQIDPLPDGLCRILEAEGTCPLLH